MDGMTFGANHLEAVVVYAKSVPKRFGREIHGDIEFFDTGERCERLARFLVSIHVGGLPFDRERCSDGPCC